MIKRSSWSSPQVSCPTTFSHTFWPVPLQADVLHSCVSPWMSWRHDWWIPRGSTRELYIAQWRLQSWDQWPFIRVSFQLASDLSLTPFWPSCSWSSCGNILASAFLHNIGCGIMTDPTCTPSCNHYWTGHVDQQCPPYHCFFWARWDMLQWSRPP